MSDTAIPPVVCVVGWKNSGKTTVTVDLIGELTGRGYRVHSVKHGHGFDLDTPGTDSWRHRHEGGAERVLMAGPRDMALVGRWGREGEPELYALVRSYLRDADLVVAEGFKKEPFPKIEVFRTGVASEPIYRADETEASRFVAIVTDVDDLDLDIPMLPLGHPGLASELADIVEERVLERTAPSE